MILIRVHITASYVGYETNLKRIDLPIDLLNDLWKYRMNDSTWTWISGSNTTNQPGNYGSKGNASTTNVPGARAGAVAWYDSSTLEFWLFGGDGYARMIPGMLYSLVSTYQCVGGE